MALAYDGAIQRLIDAFAKLPGIGPKGAQRIAFYLLGAPDDEAQRLTEAIAEVVKEVAPELSVSLVPFQVNPAFYRYITGTDHQ